ncbi:hypothetical protein QBC40DRAFT_300252 [Triangularia verruculosa]|uniref:Uncharacterized protein n=1 Tax=Triangularia verruculosa TaxID=2587418 RepID=A0AAN6X9N3_9PEZI|nr:hypothetical protein QBC40DRAFT_300252 [Triangularia verruculosa]
MAPVPVLWVGAARTVSAGYPALGILAPLNRPLAPYGFAGGCRVLLTLMTRISWYIFYYTGSHPSPLGCLPRWAAEALAEALTRLYVNLDNECRLLALVAAEATAEAPTLLYFGLLSLLYGIPPVTTGMPAEQLFKYLLRQRLCIGVV